MGSLELRYLYYSALALAFLSSIIRWKRLSTSTRIFGIFMLYTLAHEQVVFHFKSAAINFPLYVVYASLAALVYGYFCSAHAVTRRLKQLITAVSFLFAFAGAIVAMAGVESFPSMHITIGQFIIIASSFALIYDLMNKRFHERLWRDPVFLIAANLFLYHSFVSIYLAAMKVLMSENVDHSILQMFHLVTSCGFYLTIAYLLFRYRKPQQAS